MMGNQDGGATWGVGSHSIPAKADYGYAAPSAPPAPAPSAPPAPAPLSGPGKESLYPKIQSQAQYASWPSNASYQYVPPPTYDGTPNSPYASQYNPYTSSAPPPAIYGPPPVPGYPRVPPYPQPGNPYANAPGPYGVPVAPPHLQRIGTSVPDSPRMDDRFRAQSMGGAYGRTDPAPMAGPPSPYVRTDSMPYGRNDSGYPSPYGWTDSVAITDPYGRNDPSRYNRVESVASTDPYGRSDSAPVPGPYGRTDSVAMANPYIRTDSVAMANPYGRNDQSPYSRIESVATTDPYGRPDAASMPGPYGRNDPSPYSRIESVATTDPYGRPDAVSMPGPYGQTDAVSMHPGFSGGPSPYVRMDSGVPPQYSQSMSSQPPVYQCGPINTGGAQYGPGSPRIGTEIVPTTPRRDHITPPTLLHGTLEVLIIQATRLPNMDGISQSLNNLASSLNIMQKMRVNSDPYVTVVLANARVARTRVVDNEENPRWDEQFSIPVAHPVHDIIFTVRDQDWIGTDYIGHVKIPVERVLNGGVVADWFDVLTPQGKLTKSNAQLELKMSYVPVEQDSVYMEGSGSHAVPQTYFPCRMGCRLVLYQDAHIYDNTLPTIGLHGGQIFKPRNCWEELCAAIYDAQHLIYIAGWSVYDKTRLIRDKSRPPVPGGEKTLGELLKFKATQGVRVLLLVWDDKTSHDLTFIKTDGVMNTHDEETKRYFKGTGVRCILAPRYGASKMSWFKQKVVGTLYSHHQKMTIVDSGPPDRRTVTSFIGGLDLTGGRWDTPSHRLFSSLEDEHKNDFRNKSWPYAPDSGGPRQPWHDWHCKIEGHAAYDVLTNFEQRWKKATKKHDEELLDLDRIKEMVAPSNKAPRSGDPALFVTPDYDAETWQVQIFRSIDSGSVKGFPLTAKEVTEQFLVWGKSVAIDISIQMAYIKAIRCAQHFIYIENQYFLGSSYNWPDYKTAGANHLIPMELALKICSKIKEDKRFAVYIVIPMWPEGVPESGPVQEILYFQTQTMKMMYRLIADALRESGNTHRKPTDYLNFYCLGNRETKRPGELEPRNAPNPNSNQGKSQRNRRMMIYVHSKGMIVDDEYVISGSANINQRSMDGSRDTEIAMGGYQPHHTWAKEHGRPKGQVHGYRMSLWAEHLGGALERIYEEPESLECVRRVNDIADRNWEQYAAQEVTDLAGHLIRYPLRIEDNGTVCNLPGVETFPDVGGKIMGSNQEKLPDDLTA